MPDPTACRPSARSPRRRAGKLSPPREVRLVVRYLIAPAALVVLLGAIGFSKRSTGGLDQAASEPAARATVAQA